jgi:LPXTG-site transpeptidase (sortase) family protein
MMRQVLKIYNSRRQKLKNLKPAPIHPEDWDGDSGVGQAPEFPSQSLKNFFLKRFIAFLGLTLMFLGIAGFGYSYWPIIKVEVGYKISQLIPQQPPQPKGSFADIVNKNLLGEIEGVPDPNFSLIIPKIHAKGKIIPQVDVGNIEEYKSALKEGVAQAKGTRFPGEIGNIFLFAHSTDTLERAIAYNAVFYLLKELEIGDNIEIYYQAVKHRYTVFDKKIVEPSDVFYLTPDNPEKEEQVVLQTCYPPGTTWKRLLVFAKKTASP